MSNPVNRMDPTGTSSLWYCLLCAAYVLEHKGLPSPPSIIYCAMCGEALAESGPREPSSGGSPSSGSSSSDGGSNESGNKQNDCCYLIDKKTGKKVTSQNNKGVQVAGWFSRCNAAAYNQLRTGKDAKGNSLDENLKEICARNYDCEKTSCPSSKPNCILTNPKHDIGEQTGQLDDANGSSQKYCFIKAWPTCGCACQ